MEDKSLFKCFRHNGKVPISPSELGQKDCPVCRHPMDGIKQTDDQGNILWFPKPSKTKQSQPDYPPISKIQVPLPLFTV